MKACRVLVNTPSAVGGIGNMYNELIPSYVRLWFMVEILFLIM